MTEKEYEKLKEQLSRIERWEIYDSKCFLCNNDSKAMHFDARERIYTNCKECGDYVITTIALKKGKIAGQESDLKNKIYDLLQNPEMILVIADKDGIHSELRLEKPKLAQHPPKLSVNSD